MKPASQESRAAALLRVGSHPVAPAPRPGFETRLRARIAAAAEVPRPSWTDGLGRVARPSLGIAASVTLAVVVVGGWSLQRGGHHDLERLAETDPVLEAVLSDGLDQVVVADENGTDDPAEDL